MSLVKYTTPPITFTHVDTRGNTASRKGHDLERGKVRLAEHVDLEVLAPRQVLDELGRRVDELLELGAELLVHDRSEALPLRARAVGVDVGLDELRELSKLGQLQKQMVRSAYPNICLHHRPHVLHPLRRGVLVSLDAPCLKRLNVPIDHPLLRRVRRVLLRLRKRGVHLRQRTGEVAVLHGDLCGRAVYGRVVRGAGEVGFGGGDEEDEFGG